MIRKIGIDNSSEQLGGSYWHDELKFDEKIVWEGRPQQGLLLAENHKMHTFAGILLVLSGMLINILAFQDYIPESAKAVGVFGFVLILAGIHIAFLGKYLDAIRRKKIYYALSNKHAYIAKKGSWVSIRSFPITYYSSLELEGDNFERIVIARKKRLVEGGFIYTEYKFDNLGNGKEVFHLMRQIQEENKP